MVSGGLLAVVTTANLLNVQQKQGKTGALELGSHMGKSPKQCPGNHLNQGESLNNYKHYYMLVETHTDVDKL